MQNVDTERLEGTFTLPSGAEVEGYLSNLDSNPVLNLFSREYFRIDASEGIDIHGICYNQARVSLLDCSVTSQGKTSDIASNTSSYLATAYPNIVLAGEDHLGSSDRRIQAVHFEISDASTLFHDTGAFGMVQDAADWIEKLLESPDLASESSGHDDARIYYYTGKREIFSVQTKIGRISAGHYPSLTLPSARGFRMDNAVLLSIEFPHPCTVSEATRHAAHLQQFTEILIGRPQTYKQFELSLESDADYRVNLTLKILEDDSTPPTPQNMAPHPSDVLIAAGQDTEEVQRTLIDWLARQPDWNDARQRFAASFRKQNFYDVDRVVGAANMFDILPSGVVPDIELDQALAGARDRAREDFLRLPCSLGRSSVLSVLGRLGKPSLKQKVRHRARSIVDVADDLFPELQLVLDEAVNCRNHYVHGSEHTIAYNENFHCVVFFVDSLEFVFAVSDLVDAGWDFDKWRRRSSTASHPFSQYRFGYRDNLGQLKELLSVGG